MSEKDIKILEKAARSAHILYNNIEILDFQLEKFNKFEQKISSFRLFLPVTMGATGLVLGTIIGFFTQKQF